MLKFPQSASNFQSKTQLPTSKNPFFQFFFYLFPHKHLQIYTISKNPRFSTKCAAPSNIGGRAFTNNQLPISLGAKRKTLMGTTNNHLSIINNHFAFAALHLSRALYKSTLFMQNKPNFWKSQMNISSVLTKDYENKPRLPAPGKQTQSNPIPTPPFLPQKSPIFEIPDFQNPNTIDSLCFPVAKFFEIRNALHALRDGLVLSEENGLSFAFPELSDDVNHRLGAVTSSALGLEGG